MLKGKIRSISKLSLLPKKFLWRIYTLIPKTSLISFIKKILTKSFLQMLSALAIISVAEKIPLLSRRIFHMRSVQFLNENIRI
ncbi:MAG: hypothetical protein AUJ54_03300 [Ignavibacteria bacterium CG1_02_37_35]|nr:MAG: hypothetical protein AUJ54_03300 [Ignavibacteria bacterium CG1_02_37_35]